MGWGYVCGVEKTRGKKKRNVWMQGKKGKIIKRIKLINVTTIFSQYFTINFK